jgi:hypothetical protein
MEEEGEQRGDGRRLGLEAASRGALLVARELGRRRGGM